jgi:hypothetical protein
MRDMIRVIFLVEGDGRPRPSKLCQGGEGMNGVHLLLGDAALPVGSVHLGVLEDHKAVLGLGELTVFLLGTVCWVTSLQGRLLGLALLAVGATDVVLHGSTVHDEMLCLPLVEGAVGLERLLKVL